MKAFITTDIDEENLKRLKAKINEIVYEPWHKTSEIYFDAKSLLPKLEGVDIFISEGDEIPAEAIEKSNLKIIASCRGTPDKVDVAAATKKNIPVLYTPGRNADSVADLTLTFILALARKLTELDRFIHSDKFEVTEFSDWVKILNTYSGIMLKDKIVGFIGFGQIGVKVAQRLLPFGVKMLIYDPYVSDNAVSIYGKKADLETIAKSSDIITIHAAPVKETKGLVSADLISKMKKGVLFINTARASIVDNEALQKAIAEGIIGGAALDVFDMEPLDENNEFLKFNNVICTPHIGSVTDGCIAIQSKMVVDDILAILDKKEPVNILNPEVLGLKKPEKTIVQLGQEIIDTCKTLVKEGFVSGSAGNVSVRIPDKELMLITPSQKAYDDLNFDDLVLVDFNGKVVSGKRNPSVEKDLHLGIYKARPDVSAVIHSHGKNSIAFSLVRDELPPIIEEFVPYVGGSVKVAKYGQAGSEELAANIIEALENKSAAIALNHGNVCVGSHLKGALTIVRMVENAIEVYMKAATLGEPRVLNEEVVENEKEMFEIFKEDKKI